jgi:hypothetical protein
VLFRVNQKGAPALAKVGQFFAPVTGNHGCSRPPLERLTQLGPAGQPIELVGAERKVAWVNRPK